MLLQLVTASILFIAVLAQFLFVIYETIVFGLLVYMEFLTNIYHTNKILGLVFINHELDSERGEGTLVLYDTNQKILYDTV